MSDECQYHGERVGADHPENLAACVARRLTDVGVAPADIVSVHYEPAGPWALLVYRDDQKYYRRRSEIAAREDQRHQAEEPFDVRGLMVGQSAGVSVGPWAGDCVTGGDPQESCPRGTAGCPLDHDH